MRHFVHEPSLTVGCQNSFGETCDLNATGEPCETWAELRAFIHQLHEQGAYDADVMDTLLEEEHYLRSASLSGHRVLWSRFTLAELRTLETEALAAGDAALRAKVLRAIRLRTGR